MVAPAQAVAMVSAQVKGGAGGAGGNAGAGGLGGAVSVLSKLGSISVTNTGSLLTTGGAGGQAGVGAGGGNSASGGGGVGGASGKGGNGGSTAALLIQQSSNNLIEIGGNVQLQGGNASIVALTAGAGGNGSTTGGVGGKGNVAGNGGSAGSLSIISQSGTIQIDDGTNVEQMSGVGGLGSAGGAGGTGTNAGGAGGVGGLGGNSGSTRRYAFFGQNRHYRANLTVRLRALPSATTSPARAMAVMAEPEAAVLREAVAALAALPVAQVRAVLFRLSLPAHLSMLTDLSPWV